MDEPAPSAPDIGAPGPEHSIRPVAITRTFTGEDLPTFRALIRTAGIRSGVASEDLDGLVIAASEVMTNAVQHGGGVGWLTIDQQAGRLFVEVGDYGPGLPDDLIVGQPPADALSGRGLWLACVLCADFDLVSVPTGVTVRMVAPCDI